MALFLLTALVISLFASLPGQACALAANIAYSRIELTIPVNVSTNTAELNYDTPKNQTQLTGLIQEFFSAPSNLTALITGTVPLTASYEIYGELYIPKNWNSSRILEFAVHGSMLDHNYWLIGGAGSMFNYVESAVTAGNAIFVFDRLGNGKSSKPDGIKEVQAAVHIAIIENLLTYLRTTTIQGFSFKNSRIAGVGHSYGSVLLANLLATRPDAFDGVILTGFTANTGGSPVAGASVGWAFASQSNHTAFGSLSNSYMTTQTSLNLQQTFFFFPNFPQSTLDFLTEHRGVITVGELLSNPQALPTNVASDYVGPVLVVTGDHDFAECGGENCYQAVPGFSNAMESVRPLFPNASDFQTFLAPDSGHCFHAHFSAPQSFKAIHDFISISFW